MPQASDMTYCRSSVRYDVLTIGTWCVPQSSPVEAATRNHEHIFCLVLNLVGNGGMGYWDYYRRP